MKRMMVALAMMVLCSVSAKADFFWSTWNDAAVKGKDVKGCVLGLASEVNSVQGAQVDLVMSTAKEVKSGAQWALFRNKTNTLRNGAQLAFIMNDAESAALQLGLVCFNKTGFIPVCIFFNFDSKMFGKAK